MSTFDERVSRLRERIEQGHPENWLPEQQGDEIIGVLKRVSMAHARHSGQVPVLVLDVSASTGVDGDERSVWLLHTVLRREVLRAKPEPGEMLAIRYDGKKIGGDIEYEDYTVVVDREQEAVDWNVIAAKLGEEVEAEPDPLRGPVPPHPAPEPEVKCEDCGFAGGKHADGCPSEDIPF